MRQLACVPCWQKAGPGPVSRADAAVVVVEGTSMCEWHAAHSRGVWS